MARVIDDEPTADDLDELAMTREDLVERFEQGTDVVIERARRVIMRDSTVDAGGTSMAVSVPERVQVRGSTSTEPGVSLQR